MGLKVVRRNLGASAVRSRAAEDLSARALANGLTETYQAERFAAAYGNDLRYDHQRKVWFIYREHVWKPDCDGEMKRLAIECVRSLQQQAPKVPDSAPRMKLLSFCKWCESLPGIQRVLGIAQNLAPIAIAGREWNQDPWLLGAPNGVIDLKSATLRKGRREDMVSLSVGVQYDPEADCPRWRRFVSEVFGGDQELVEYLQRALGYSLTGLTSEQVWFLLHGDGANGKTTLLNVVGLVLGGYAKTVAFNMFVLPERSSVPDDVATLVDRRFVRASESIEAAHLNEARIKMLSGSDRIAARPLFGKWFEFEPRLKLFLGCNHRPRVVDDSHGFWRRVRVLPFTQRFDGRNEDKQLPEHLKAEGSGILNWMLEGCLRWQAQGMMAPAMVMVATTQYESESNPLNDFIAEQCEEGSDFQAPAKGLYDAYVSWMKSERPTATRLTLTAFGRWMRKRFRKQHLNDGNVYYGVQLKDRPTPSA